MYASKFLAGLLPALFMAQLAWAANDADVEALQQKLDAMQQSYDQQLQDLRSQLQATSTPQAALNSFNPAITVILDGRFASFANDPEAYHLPGFMLGGEAGVGEAGFGTGHLEFSAMGNIDNLFWGQLTTAIAEHEGETELELEEAFIQTLGLGGGFMLRAGRFYSALGYMNEHHEHAWDFTDAPLVYRALFGNQLVDDGIQLNYIAPTTTVLLQLGAEALRGAAMPAGGEHDGIGAWTVFANLGGDAGIGHSWQLGLSHYEGDADERTGGGHDHGGNAETPAFTGNSVIDALDMQYKWAPNGNPRFRHLMVIAELFQRQEDGEVELLDALTPEISSYTGTQKGGYAQVIWQFHPRWRVGSRVDRLFSDNRGEDEAVLEEAGLYNEGHAPERFSYLVEWLPTEYTKVRVQYNNDYSYENRDDQFVVQYTMSLGSHGAHEY